MNLLIDYMDADVAYLLGLLVARGELLTSENTYRAIVHFPKGSLLAQGINTHFDSDREIRLGIEKIRERLTELLGADIRTSDGGDSWDLVARFTRNTMAWRNINMLLGSRTSFHSFEIPEILFDERTPIEFKREFVKGFADVAGNIRPANRDQLGRHRVRLDILNYPTNWHVAMRLCLLLQDELNVPVPVLTWGHPDLNREWREHQLNVYAEEFTAIGFYFDFKQAALEELAKINLKHFSSKIKGCPGARRLGKRKKKDPEERNAEKLPPELLAKHFNSYWQICRALGCPRRPVSREQLELMAED
ncbi:MAG: hypothetical protein FJZ94_04265 [Chloroflexi bacterium]|nr:hypothetical protein [Chloroflexota bacterium]